MEYVLRACICKHKWKEYVKEVIKACHYAGIKEVMLCEDGDFISAIAQPLSSHREMAEILKKAVVMFKNEGIVCGFYIKSLIGHFSCNQFALPYQKFVGENGEESLNELCILDQEYVEYMKELFACYAACGFESMMVDDDFRSLNHCNGQNGCFCDLHIRETSKLYGETLTRQEVISAMQGGKDEKTLKIRECFRKANFAGQLYAAKGIEEAIHSVDKNIRIGLMSGTPEGEEYQGRDTEKLLAVFAGDGNKKYFRPAGGYYFDTLGDALFYGFLNGCETRQYLGKEIDYISEVDIYTPRNSFTKSVKMLDLQLKMHALAGYKKYSLNIFDHFGTSPFQYNEFLDLLKDNKQSYDEIEKAIAGKTLFGIGRPLKKGQMKEYFGRKEKGKAYDYLLLKLNLPLCYGTSKVTMLDSIAVDFYADEEIEALLKDGVILDNGSVKKLCERGFSSLLGVEYIAPVEQSCFEVLTVHEWNGCYANFRFPVHVGNVYGEDPTYLYRVNEKAKVLSVLTDAKMNEISPSTVLFENELGGRVMCLATPFVENNWLHKGRLLQMQNATEWLFKGELPFTLENAKKIMSAYYEGESEDVLVLYNFGFDKETFALRHQEERIQVDMEGLTIRTFTFQK